MPALPPVQPAAPISIPISISIEPQDVDLEAGESTDVVVTIKGPTSFRTEMTDIPGGGVKTKGVDDPKAGRAIWTITAPANAPRIEQKPLHITAIPGDGKERMGTFLPHRVASPAADGQSRWRTGKTQSGLRAILKVEKGVVTELDLIGDKLRDISPAQSFTGLRRVKCDSRTPAIDLIAAERVSRSWRRSTKSPRISYWPTPTKVPTPVASAKKGNPGDDPVAKSDPPQARVRSRYADLRQSS